MKKVLFDCYDTGVIVERAWDYAPQFATVKKYDILYREELPRFLEQPFRAYGLPLAPAPQAWYSGAGRMGLDPYDTPRNDLSDAQRELLQCTRRDDAAANQLMANEDSAQEYLHLFHDAKDYELIWIKPAGSNVPAPATYQLAGYDICYPPNYAGGFSIICDCMFICHWHGCDEDGTLFTKDFAKLNANGLFSNWNDAYRYMVKYLNEEWSERGTYGIFEIYTKAEIIK